MTNTRLPAEWEEQSAIQMTWPNLSGEWADLLEEAEITFIQIAKEISQKQKLLIVCSNRFQLQSTLSSAGANMDNIILAEILANDVWARDHGAITVYKNNEACLLDFAFNGWGLKYKANYDNHMSRNLYEKNFFGKNKFETIGLVLEGGSIESDGKGSILTTSACLLSPNRNPHLSKVELEAALSKYLGAKRILWLEHGFMAGDDTDCHIDTLARFCDANTITYMSCEDSTDEHFQELKLMEKELQGFKTSSGKPYRLLPLPMPQAIYNTEGIRLPATYANFLIINSAVLAPVYGDAADEKALNILKEAFPQRKIIPVNCKILIMQRGSLHCATMQFPQGVF